MIKVMPKEEIRQKLAECLQKSEMRDFLFFRFQ